MGISRDSRPEMPRNIYFGNDINVILLAVIHNFPYVLLAVIPFHFDAVAHGLLARAAHFGEQGILVGFYSPALIVGQMPMESVYFQQRQHVNLLLISSTVKMPYAIEHIAPI